MRGFSLSPYTFAAVKAAKGPYKLIAYQYGISQAHVYRIKSGKVRHRSEKKADIPRLNAELITLACAPEYA